MTRTTQPNAAGESGTADAENEFTNWLDLTGKPWSVGAYGTWVGTLTIQAVAPGGDVNTPADIQELETDITGNFSRAGDPLFGGWKVRVGFKTGGFTSGSAKLSVFQGA